jgi:hypothetical protein
MAGKYIERVNYKDHALNNCSLLLNKVHTAVGVESIKCEYYNPQNTIGRSADGHAIFQSDPDLTGFWTIGLLQSSETNTYLWDLLQSDAQFRVSFADANAPELDSRSISKIEKPPAITREKEAVIYEWILICTYLDAKDGGYALSAV